MAGRKKQAQEKVAVNFAMEKNLKNEWSAICEELGMAMSGAIHLLASQMVRERKLPFTPDATKTDARVMNEGHELVVEQSRNDNNTEILLQYLKLLQKEKEDKE